MTPALRDRLLALAGLAGAALCIHGFFSISALYQDFHLAYGTGIVAVPWIELVFYLWFFVFGGGAVIGLTVALRALQIAGPLDRAIDRLIARPRTALALIALTVFGEAVLIRAVVFQDAPMSDDETAYRFIAQTLLEGRVTNPSPGDIRFFTYPFVIHDAAGWYGKYPIGHPLLLAVGEAVGLRALINPLLCAIASFLTFSVGRRVFSEKIAMTGALLLLVSPQFLFTGATDFSQPASAVCMLAGVYAVLRLCDGGGAGWAFAAGSAFGFGVLTRPLPGVLFLAVGGLYLLCQRDLSWSRRLVSAAVALVPLGLFAAIFLAVNHAQTGSFLTTGYQVEHSDTGILQASRFAFMAGSVAGALVRQHFWLLGWALGMFFVPFARGRHLLLLWLTIGAAFLYRIIAAKTVIGVTGPIYMFEIVPLLVLFTVSGAHRIATTLDRRATVVRAILASVIVAVVCFVPIHAENLRRSSDTYLLSTRIVEPHAPALVFANAMVYQERNDSWAYFPPPPHPDMSDPVIYVRRGVTAEEMYAFWQKRFPKRRAFVFGYLRKKAVLFEVKSPADFGGSGALLYQEP